MGCSPRSAFLIAAIAVVVWTPTVSGQPGLMPSAYDILDLGPVAAPGQCSCIGTPFTVTFPPGPNGSGPAAPLGPPRMSADDRKSAAARLTEERAWLPQRAEQGLAGDSTASFSVAMHLMFESAFLGEDAARDQEVFRWMYQAAVQGHPDAFMFLAHRYARGLGVARDDIAAARWFRRAASADNAMSMTALGLLHAAGRGVPQDWGAAFAWWERARSRTPLAARFAGDALACGLGVEQNHERAVAAYKAAAEKGDVTGSIQLGHMYANGCAEGGPEKALTMFRSAADEGHPEAQIALSEMLRLGRGSDPDVYRAYFWASLAERRLPEGELKTLAARRAKAAAGLLSSFLIADADKMVDSMIASSLDRPR